MKSGYGSSEHTPKKQEMLRDILALHLTIVNKIKQKRRIPTRYIFIDLHAGMGKDPETQADGSPLIVFKQLAFGAQNLQPELWLYEKDGDHRATLKTTIGSWQKDFPRVKVDIRGNHLVELVSKLTGMREQQHTYGILYCDPTNHKLPFDIFEAMNHIFPKIDILIHYLATSRKRVAHSPLTAQDVNASGLIMDRLSHAKKFWYPSRIYEANGERLFLLGVNWDRFPEWKGLGLYAHDSPKAQEILNKISFTRSEREQGLDQQLATEYRIDFHE